MSSPKRLRLLLKLAWHPGIARCKRCDKNSSAVESIPVVHKIGLLDLQKPQAGSLDRQVGHTCAECAVTMQCRTILSGVS